MQVVISLKHRVMIMGVVTAFLLMVLLVIRVEANEISVGDAIGRYEKYLQSVSSMEFHYEIPGKWRETGHLKKDGEKMWVSSQSVSGGNTEFVIHSDGIGTSCYDSPDGVSVASVLSPMKGKRYNTCQVFQCSFLFGSLPVARTTDCDNLVSLFRSGGTVLLEERLDSIETVKLQKNVGDIQVSVWLVSSKNYAHCRLRVESSNTQPDEVGRTVLTDIRVADFAAVNDTFMPQNCHMKIKNVGLTYAEENGKPVEKKFISDGQVKMIFSDFKVKKFNENDFKITTNILNGTPVYMEDAPHIAHIWMDGKIEPKTNELMLRIAQGNHKFIPSADEPRFWVIALGVLLIVIGFTAKIITVVKKWRNKK